jgi:O-antigen/teichoic acid export membrane protein
VPFTVQLKTCIIISLTIYANFFTNLLRLQEKAILFFVGSVIKSIVMGFLNIILLVVFKRDYSSYLDSMIIALLAVSIWGLIYYLRNFPIRTLDLKLKKFRSLLWLGIPLVPNGILALINNSTDKYILNFYLATATVGIYSMGYKIGSSLDSFLTTPLGQAFSPIAYRSYANDLEKYKDLTRRVWHLFIILAFTLILLVVVFLDGLYFFFISNNYWSSYWIVILVLSAYFIWGSAIMLGATIVVREKTYLSPLLTGLSGGINILFNFVFIPRWGMLGAGFSLVLSFIIVFIGYYFITQRLIFIEHLWSEIAKSGIVFCISMAILLGLSSLESFKLYKVLLKVLIFAGYLAVMLILNKKELKSLARIL